KASPRWLRMVTGVLLFPGLWLGAIFAFDSAVPLVRTGALGPGAWLPPTALFAAVVAWLAGRRASTRLLAPLGAVAPSLHVGPAGVAEVGRDRRASQSPHAAGGSPKTGAARRNSQSSDAARAPATSANRGDSELGSASVSSSGKARPTACIRKRRGGYPAIPM